VGPEFVTVSAGGGVYSAFESVQVTAAFNEAARSFSLDLAAPAGGDATAAMFYCGTPVEISANGELLCAAYVDRFEPHLSDHNQAIVKISGRGKGQDAIDSSAMHPTGYFKNQTPLQIAQALDKFGIGFTSDQQMQPVPFYHLTPGETVFRCIEKLCRQEGLLLAGQPDGSIKLTKLGGGAQAPLIEGRNCKVLRADHNWAGRHSHVIARGQRPIGAGGADTTQIEHTATDGAVTRYRPHVLVIDGDTDNTRAAMRARYRIMREAGHSLKATVTVQGFHDDGGALWTPGNTVFLDSPFLAVHQLMGIERVVYAQARKAGSLSHLSLVDPAALGGSGGEGGSAGSSWNTDIGADESASQ
jgi:prophage tail gpP-like protein